MYRQSEGARAFCVPFGLEVVVNRACPCGGMLVEDKGERVSEAQVVQIGQPARLEHLHAQLADRFGCCGGRDAC